MMSPLLSLLFSPQVYINSHADAKAPGKWRAGILERRELHFFFLFFCAFSG